MTAAPLLFFVFLSYRRFVNSRKNHAQLTEGKTKQRDFSLKLFLSHSGGVFFFFNCATIKSES